MTDLVKIDDVAALDGHWLRITFSDGAIKDVDLGELMVSGGVFAPIAAERALFEFLVLEGAQAGLSWITILRKREAYRRAFAGFDPAKVARFTPARVRKLLADPGIVRNRAKVAAAIANARAFLAVVEEHGSFARYVWDFVGGTALQGRRRTRHGDDR